MTHDDDQRIAALLRDCAPAERDPMFRVSVLDGLERAKYRRRLAALVACAVALGVIALLGVGLGGAAREATSVLLIGAALVVLGSLLAPALSQLLARFRG